MSARKYAVVFVSQKSAYSHSRSAHEPASADEDSDDDQSELSYASYPSWYPADRSVASPSSANSGTNRSTPHGSPDIVMLSEDESCRPHTRGLEESLVGLLDAVSGLQRLSNPDGQTPNPSTGHGNQVFGQPAVMEHQVTHTSADPLNESGGPTTPGSNSQNVVFASGVRDADDLVGARNLLSVATNGRVHGPSGQVDDAPRSHEDTRNAAPPPTNTRAHPAPPLRRVRTRGVFIIGDGAPIRIDDGIEVHLRDGVDGQVDFIM